jgi:hypothetical protein
MEVEEQAFRDFLSRGHDLLESVSSSKRKEIDRSLRSLLTAIENHFYR